MPSDPIVNDHFGDILWMNGEKLHRYYWKYVLNLKDVKMSMKNKIINKIYTACYIKLMKIKSYSKINLSLRIQKKLKNGMHNIEPIQHQLTYLIK